jgi:hypothetical protein
MTVPLSKLNRSILIFCKVLYVVQFVAAIVVFLHSIFKIYKFGFLPKTIFDFLDTAILCLVSYLVYYLFSQALIAFDIWLSQDEAKDDILIPLRKLIAPLYAIASVEVVRIVLHCSLGAEVEDINQGLKSDILSPFMQFMAEYKPLIYDVLRFIIPRPTGISAIIVALFVTQIIKMKSQNSRKLN